ncbi:AAA family ATPase [Clostridium gasigenes]|uniref:AAA family ATPase n=1 Tax=Clostridium gasigenes TaxID=94869 RepID=A0A7X0RBB6_9CLOT|nr:AAA family ATPase [Clostridium gasigenes]MBB6623948.1 AAA family ATPase [Clostridium gasigenes]MBB6716052.1 AAA family ATPase [Clostridium gasigenes]
MEIDKILNEIIIESFNYGRINNHEYITPEHLLYSALENEEFKMAIVKCGGDVDNLKNKIEEYINEHISKVEEGIDVEESFGFRSIFYIATEQAKYSEKSKIGIEHLMAAMFLLEDSYALYYLQEEGVTKAKLLFNLCHREENDDNEDGNEKDNENNYYISYEDEDSMEEVIDDEYSNDTRDSEKDEIESKSSKKSKKNKSIVEKYTTNMTNFVKSDISDPLIGREDIINRTLQILCRRTKNNTVHVGEPGVGKTAIVLGLAKLIVDGKIPNKLKDAEIFSLDIGSLLAGTKYRGDFEERIKGVLDGLSGHANPIVYIDEIHNIVGAGALNAGALDASNLLKPYLMEGKIRFIGTTTFDEYKKHFEKDKGLSRRFQKIEVKETTIEETIKILNGLKENYESYHNVKYTEEAIISAVKLSHKYINDKFLPDKAIDIIDEAGAFIAMNAEKDQTKTIDENIIEDIISRICSIPKQKVENEEVNSLKQLEYILKDNVFGQSEAINEVVRCIKMSRAGLNDDNKPVASMLFVGPTGVGKTEIAKILSKTLSVDLVRFDMSEYAEKHSASKLIGSPPGYVGYEEGGLLTDAIRKKPNCVLLLDEIEKANGDILNVLLQVMDYATLTDNQGRKIDFRNVILIMTSNAGARNIGKNLVGFGQREIKGEAITEEIKKIFTPEFRNRLDKVVVFNHVDKDMAEKIVKKELSIFKEKLKSKNVTITFTKECIEFISKAGVSKEFGAREIIRIINSKLKPLLVDKILFGELCKGGACNIELENNELKLKIV